MKRGGRALLCGAITVVLLCSAALAQSSVNLVGINAGQDGNAAVIELHTSAPADFVLDRFTMGKWLTVWSSKFELADGIKEIPLEFERAELADMVTGLSLVRNKQSGAVRIYLGGSADMRAASISRDGNLTTIRVPLKAEASPRTLSVKSSFAVRSKEDTALAAQETEETAPGAGDSSADAEDGVLDSSFRADSDGVGLLAMADKPVAGEAGLKSPSIAALMEDTTRLVQDSSISAAAPARSGTGANGEFYRPFKGGMQPTSSYGSFAVTNAIPVDGKDALRGVKIEQYQIMATPLDQALTLLVAPTGFNVIVDSSVGTNNSISLSFKDQKTDLRNAMDLITKANGLDYVVQAGTIVVGTKDKLYGNDGLVPFATRIFVLDYAEPRSVKQILLQTGIVTSNQVEIYSEKPTGNTGGGDGQDAAQGAAGGAQQADSAGGANSQTAPAGGGQATASPNNVSTTPQNAILIKAIPEHMDRVAAIISEIDRRPQMVELEVRVCEANETALKDLGVAVNRIGDVVVTGESWSEQRTNNANNGGSPFEAFSIEGFDRSGLNFNVSLAHQLDTGNLRILAQPTLTTAEGKTANYFAGDRVPYIRRPANNTGGASQAAEVDFIDLGVKLNFTPRIDADGKVTIDVRPEVSTLVGFIDLGSGAQAPRSTQRELQTTVRVDNCEPFVLAGLISEFERESVNRIPLLSELPMVGKLFRQTTKNKTRTEIIIIVVPKVKD